MQIIYCETCGSRIPQSEFDGSAAEGTDAPAYCANCKPKSTAAKKSERLAAARGSKITPARTSGGSGVSGRGLSPMRSKDDGSSSMLFLMLGVGVLILGVIVFMFNRRESPSASESTAPSAPPSPAVIHKDPLVSAPNPKPVTPSRTPTTTGTNSPPGPTPQTTDSDMEKLLAARAAKGLEEAKKFFADHPEELIGYKSRLEGIATTYRSTPSGPEAAKLLEKVLEEIAKRPKPPPPALPPSDAAWKQIFDGKSLDGFNPNSLTTGVWKLEDGTLVRDNTKVDNSMQTRDNFGDGVYRIRFACKGLDSVYFSIRQAAGNYKVWMVDEAIINAGEDKIHELVITSLGDQVTATLNGKSYPVKTEGAPPREGHITFNGKGTFFHVLSIEIQPAK